MVLRAAWPDGGGQTPFAMSGSRPARRWRACPTDASHQPSRAHRACNAGRATRHTLGMAPGSWLFVRGTESIWIVRPHGCSLIVEGPGSSRQEHDFDDEAAIQAYQVSIAEELSEHGWRLEAVDRERRSGRDRRGAERTTPDRRRQRHL